MFCKECGSELAEGKAFCTKCGAPVKTAVPPAGAAPSPPAAGPAPDQPKKSKKTLVIIAVIVGVLIIAGAVTAMLLIFLTPSGPTASVDKFFSAAQTKNLDGAMKVIDTSYFADNQDLEKVFKENIFSTIPDGTKFTGLTYETNVKGDSGTVKIVKGTATYKVSGKTETADLSQSSSDNTFDMVKKDGTWYISPSSFGDLFAAQYKKEAESRFAEEITKKVKEVEGAFSSLNTFMTAQPLPAGTAMQDKLNAVQPVLDAYESSAKKVKAQFQKILDLKGRNVADYQAYAKAAINFIDTSIEEFDLTKELYKYVVDTKVKIDANQPIDKSAYSAHVDEVGKKLQTLQGQLENYQSEMDKASQKIQ